LAVGASEPLDRPRTKTYAQRLAKLLDEEAAQGMSNAQIAREIGVTPEALSRWKKRGSVPRNPRQLLLLCRRLKTHPNYLVGWTDDRYPRGEDDRLADLDKQLAERRRELRSSRKGIG
jgi:transcriptional regulator with XRE-family HTH domain